MEPGAASGGPPGTPIAWPSGVYTSGGGSSNEAASDSGRLSEYLQPSTTPAVQARVLPTERMLLPKGAFVDCTLETAIDSTLPGMTTCITASDTFGVDGKVVLLERGTKLVGETQGHVRQGAARVFVLWTEARTPTGVVVPLASPGTDALGRSGLPGEVNRHFWERFGAAILISVIDGAVQAAVQSDGGGTVIYNPSTSENIMTEVLKSTVNIPPTVVVANGERIQVLVARDLDFRSVYELRPVPAAAGTTNPASSDSRRSAHEPSGRE
jgi:type IV secretion system protein VirB10